MDARNTQRREINMLSRIVHLVGLICNIIQGCTVNKPKIRRFGKMAEEAGSELLAAANEHLNKVKQALHSRSNMDIKTHKRSGGLKGTKTGSK